MESLKDRTQELQDIMDEFAGAKKNASIFVKEAAEKGDIVIGSFCQYAPMEIINAGGMYNVLLCGFNYDPPIPLAETELPANLCPLIKSSYGNILGKTCPFAFYSDLIVGETTCDGKKKMYEMLSELKQMHVIHLPNIPDRERSLESWREELVRFKEALEERFGVKITDEKLRESIHILNQERSQMAQLYELGKLDPPATSLCRLHPLLRKGAPGLAYGQAAAIQYSGYALMLAVRLDPLGVSTLDALRSQILSDLKGEELDDALAAYGAQMASSLSSSAMSKLPAAKIVNATSANSANS